MSWIIGVVALHITIETVTVFFVTFLNYETFTPAEYQQKWSSTIDVIIIITKSMSNTSREKFWRVVGSVTLVIFFHHNRVLMKSVQIERMFKFAVYLTKLSVA
mgnify:CR=1 FL=1